MNASVFCSIKDLLADILEELQQPDVEYDFELVCNAETGVYDLYGQTTSDGVPTGPPVITPTTVSCIPEPIPVVTADIEYFCDEDLDTWHYTISTFIDGVLDNIAAAVDTGVACDDPEPDIIEIDFEVLCNEETGFWEYHTITTTNGAPAPVVIEATTVVCSPEPPVDVESVRVCNEDTNTIHVVTTIYDGINGDVISVLSDVDTGELCACRGQVDCVESQEWTYGIDNTGTNFAWQDADYIITLSDGSTLTWNQSTASNGGWSAQLTEWAANIQAAADSAGLAWFVEPRFIDAFNVTNLDGTINGPGGNPSGLPGAPSEPVAIALDAGGMVWRYVNIQICPGQPVPVSAEVEVVTDPGAAGTQSPGYTLTTAGAVLGPLQKFFVCRCCGEEPIWYLEDGITEASAGQIPDCWEPCGTLTLAASPPDRDCTFQTLIACDNNDSDLTTDFTNTITRRATVCNGEQIAVDYFQADPNDPSALVPYTLVGDFVDCATGLPIPLPEPEYELGEVCENPIYVKECPPEPCPPPSVELFCDDSGTKYVIVGHALEACGQSGTFEAAGYYATPQALVAYTPTSVAQLCEDAVIKEQECLVDECGDRWTCVTVITPVAGTVAESQTCVPFIENPDCADEEAAEGGRVAKEAKRVAVKSLTAVKSIKVSVPVINTQITETADPDTGELPVPVGETCPCPCPDDATNQDILDKLCEILDALTGTCGFEVDSRCLSYGNALIVGYKNWTDTGDFDDLAGEFGITAPASPKEMWIRITEFDCGGTAQSEQGQIFGPYPVGPTALDAFYADLEAATTGSCMVIKPNPAGTGMLIETASDTDATLVLQEGISDGAGGVDWYTSAWGFVNRGGVVGDFIESQGVANPSNFAADSTFNTYQSAESCESI